MPIALETGATPAITSQDSSNGSTMTPNSETELPEPKPGMVTDVKNLYESKPDNRGKTTWVDAIPTDLEDAAENAKSARYALLIRNKKCYDGRKSLQIDSIVVQSPLLKKSLGHILEAYPGITTTLDRLTFKSPFQPFVHRWSRLVEELKNEEDPETKSHLELFQRIMELELKDDLKARDDFILNGVITWDTCWMIFEPGTTVFTVQDGQNCAARFNSGRYAENMCGRFYQLSCQVVDWDGERFGLGNMTSSVKEFEGTAKITQLSAFPLAYHPSLVKVKKELIERGKVFEALSGYNYRLYQGIAIGQGPWGPIKYNVDSRIVIDTYAWNRFNPDRQVSLNKLEMSADKKSRVPESEEDDEDDDVDYYDEEDEEDDEEDEEDDEQEEEAAGAKHKPANLSDEQLLICSASLKGYSLRNKKWLTFAVGSVKDITFSEAAFESLVLPGQHKELILALAESQISNKNSFDDVIQGKGKGIVMLLSGPPGVGKTLTAESVAEEMKAPLYMMSAGDLGLSSNEVESSLSNVLEMATKWNAVLLLDEADVFLEQRSSNDLERNKLVSIFLRLLEYYEGILFLTTNRVDNIDAAFQSRIHVSMQYNELDSQSRRHVWSTFLNASAKTAKTTAAGTTTASASSAFSDADLDRLAAYQMNGREIKNVLKTAQLLASKKKEDLGPEHVQSVLAIEQRHVGDQSRVQGIIVKGPAE